MAVWRKHKAEIIVNDQGNRSTPSLGAEAIATKVLLGSIVFWGFNLLNSLSFTHLCSLTLAAPLVDFWNFVDFSTRKRLKTYAKPSASSFLVLPNLTKQPVPFALRPPTLRCLRLRLQRGPMWPSLTTHVSSVRMPGTKWPEIRKTRRLGRTKRKGVVFVLFFSRCLLKKKL